MDENFSEIRVNIQAWGENDFTAQASLRGYASDESFAGGRGETIHDALCLLGQNIEKYIAENTKERFAYVVKSDTTTFGVYEKAEDAEACLRRIITQEARNGRGEVCTKENTCIQSHWLTPYE